MQYLNLAGVLALAGLCLVQWRVNRSANINLIASEKTRQEQVKTIHEKQQQVKDCQIDLEALREHLIRTNLEWKQASSNLTVVQVQLHQLENERDQLKGSITNWANAVTARDVQITELGEQLKTMAAERNETVNKFNELAENYNAVVRDLNERTLKFNELAQRFNSEVKKN